MIIPIRHMSTKNYNYSDFWLTGINTFFLKRSITLTDKRFEKRGHIVCKLRYFCQSIFLLCFKHCFFYLFLKRGLKGESPFNYVLKRLFFDHNRQYSCKHLSVLCEPDR